MKQKEANSIYIREESEQLDKLVLESYSNAVRLERRNLLLVSWLILISALAGLNPSKTSILRLHFDNLSPAVYCGSRMRVNFYFLCAFAIYGLPLYRESTKSRKTMFRQAIAMSYFIPS